MTGDSSGFFEKDSEALKEILSVDDRYIVGDRIYRSEHGFAELYFVRRSGRLFVGKALRPEYRGDNAAEAALRKEFQIGFSIDTPGVVKTFDIVSDSEIGTVIVLEYCKGIDLRKFMDMGGNISGKQLENITENLISILRAVHASGVIHRDIKPSNILYDETTGGVKLIDFGCADAFDQLRFKGSAGTKFYKSGDFINQPSDDWYALSLCLAELTGFCDDKRAKKRVLTLCNDMRRGLSPVMAPKKSHTGRVLSLVIGGVIVLGVVTLLLNRKVTGETAERITDAGDTVRQSEAVIQENLKDTCHTLEQTVAPEEGSSIVSNIAAAGEVDVEKVSDEEDSPITSGLKQDNVAQGEKVQEEIRKKIMEMIIKVGNEVYWEREKKYKALDNQELLASDPNAYYRERYTSEEELFDERNCVNTILSRLIPFPSELPPDTVKAMVTDFYRHRFLGHIQRYRIR